MDKARETAVRILYEVHENGAYANVALAKALRQLDLGEQDRRFVTELVYGAVKAGGTLDWILRRYVKDPDLSEELRAFKGTHVLFCKGDLPLSRLYRLLRYYAAQYHNFRDYYFEKK